MMLEGRVAIVTGAGTGIGRAIAERFAHEGAAVVAVDIDESAVSATRTSIEDAGGTADAVVADAGDPNAVETFVNDTVALHGTAHIGVANAAVQYEKGVEDTPPADWDRVLGINLRGAYLLAKYLLPHYRRQGGGVLINMASVNAFWIEPHLGAYSAAKGGLDRTHEIDRARLRAVRCSMQLHLPRLHRYGHGTALLRHAPPSRGRPLRSLGDACPWAPWQSRRGGRYGRLPRQ